MLQSSLWFTRGLQLGLIAFLVFCARNTLTDLFRTLAAEWQDGESEV